MTYPLGNLQFYHLHYVTNSWSRDRYVHDRLLLSDSTLWRLIVPSYNSTSIYLGGKWFLVVSFVHIASKQSKHNSLLKEFAVIEHAFRML
jgi:hypothetical protein